MLNTIKFKDGRLTILDQTLLPTCVRYEVLDTLESVFEAIAKLKVRGAPLIGVAAAYGVVIGMQKYSSESHTVQQVAEVCNYLKTARPTAVNLAWALDRMHKAALAVDNPQALFHALEQEAQLIHAEDKQLCQKLGEHIYHEIEGLIHEKSINILTHCNAGALATTGVGTATSIMYLLQERGVNVCVYACETRPLLQGARLTALELSEADIPVTLITDNMAATVMSQGLVDFVIVGADRVAANGDVANKIGTLGLSLLAHHYNIPFYVACPSPTFDANTRCGDDIEIEQRAGEEITTIGNTHIAPQGVATYNPAFDVTPARYVRAIITENGPLELSHAAK